MMQPTDGLSQTMESSRARMALQSRLKLSRDGQVFILPLNQSLDMGGLRRVDLGWGGSAAETPKGLAAGDSMLTILPAAGAMNPSLTQELGSVSAGPEC